MKKIITGVLALFLLGLIGCTSNHEVVNQGEKNELRVGNMVKSIKPAMVVLASEMNFYEEEGLDLIFEDISSLNDALIAIEDDKLDIMPLGVIPTITHITKGGELVIFGGTISEGGQAVVAADNVDKIRTIDDFKGKTIAVVQAETGHMYAEYYMKKIGIDLDTDVTIVVLDGMQSVIQAVKKGEADIGWVNSGFGQVAEQQGLIVIMDIGELFPNSVCCRQTTSKKVVEEKRDALVRFQIANLRAYKMYRENPEEVIQLLMDFSGQTREYVEYCLYAEVMKVELDPCKNNVLELYDVMSTLQVVEELKEEEIKEAVDSSIYKEALDVMLERYPNDEILLDLNNKYNKNNS